MIYILPAQYRELSAQFCQWLERTFPLNCCQAGDITRKAQETFLLIPIPPKKRPAKSVRCHVRGLRRAI